MLILYGYGYGYGYGYAYAYAYAYGYAYTYAHTYTYAYAYARGLLSVTSYSLNHSSLEPALSFTYQKVPTILPLSVRILSVLVPGFITPTPAI